MARSILVGGTTFCPRMEPISHTQNKGFMFGHITLPTIHRHNPYEQHAVRVRFFHEVFINSYLRIFLGLEIDIFSKKHNTSQKKIVYRQNNDMLHMKDVINRKGTTSGGHTAVFTSLGYVATRWHNHFYNSKSCFHTTINYPYIYHKS